MENREISRWRQRFVAGFTQGRRTPERVAEIDRNPQIRSAWVARWVPFGQGRDVGLWLSVAIAGLTVAIIGLLTLEAQPGLWLATGAGASVTLLWSMIAMITMGMTLGRADIWSVQDFALRAGFEVETASPSLRVLKARTPSRLGWTNDLVAIRTVSDGGEDCRVFMPLYLYRRFARLNRPKWDGVTFTG